MTRMLPELRGLSYPERLTTLGITTLETQRLKSDLIEVFKIVKGFVNIDRKNFSRRHSVIVGRSVYDSYMQYEKLCC